jgi:DNA-directed RNA polymerase subunit K/omega
VTIIAVDQTVTDCTDPKDNKFLALAEAADAELIAASNPHLTDTLEGDTDPTSFGIPDGYSLTRRVEPRQPMHGEVMLECET